MQRVLFLSLNYTWTKVLYLDKMKPSSKELIEFIDDHKKAADHFGVSEKTICRWMKVYGIYQPKMNYGTKLSFEKAREIRKKYSDGAEIKNLAEEYHVTFSTISRIIHNITYTEIKETATVSVTYNIR
jgi:transposase